MSAPWRPMETKVIITFLVDFNSWITMYCVALDSITCITLHCMPLHVLHSTAFHFVASLCITLHCLATICIALHYNKLYFILLYYIVLHFITLHCIALNCIALHWLHCIVLYCYGMVWYGFSVILYDTIGGVLSAVCCIVMTIPKKISKIFYSLLEGSCSEQCTCNVTPQQRRQCRSRTSNVPWNSPVIEFCIKHFQRGDRLQTSE